MRFAKTALLLLLSAALLLPLLSCAKDPTPSGPSGASVSDTASAPETEAPPLSKADQALAHLPERDFDGRNLNIIQSAAFWEFDVSDLNGELLNDEIYERNQVIEERYGVTITREKVGQMSGATLLTDRIRTESMTGDATFQLVGDGAYFMSIDLRSGLYADFHRLPYIDLDAPYWDSHAVDAFTVAGKLYFINGSYTLSNKGSARVMFWNRDMAEDLNIPDLYDVVWDGKWTSDLMLEYCQIATYDVDGDGSQSFADDRWGVVYEHPENYVGFPIGMGYTLTTQDDTGNIVVDTNERNVRVIEVCEKIAAYSVMGNDWFRLKNGIGGYAGFIFDEQRALFRDGRAGGVPDVDFSFGVLPNPKLNEDQQNYISTSHYYSGANCGIPDALNAKDKDMAAFLLEALGAYSHVTVYPVYTENIVLHKNSPDPEATAVLRMVFENIYYDIGYQCCFVNPMDPFSLVFAMGVGGFASLIAGNAESINEDIRDLVQEYKNLP